MSRVVLGGMYVYALDIACFNLNTTSRRSTLVLLFLPAWHATTLEASQGGLQGTTPSPWHAATRAQQKMGIHSSAWLCRTHRGEAEKSTCYPYMRQRHRFRRKSLSLPIPLSIDRGATCKDRKKEVPARPASCRGLARSN